MSNLNKCDRFQTGRYLKAKYVDEDAAQNETLDITIEVLEDTVACGRGGA